MADVDRKFAVQGCLVRARMRLFLTYWKKLQSGDTLKLQ